MLTQHRRNFFAFVFLLMGASAVQPACAQGTAAAAMLNQVPGSGEKIYVHTDRNSYLAGELVWFRLYYLEAGSWRPLDMSKVAYVELLDRKSKPLIQAKIELGKGGGSGSFYIPSSLATDRYVLRAYTRWMRNSGAAEYFETPVTVLNTVAGLPGNTAGLQAPQIHFYPEGGQFLSLGTSVLGFRVADERGLPVEAQGIITGPAGDTIGSLATHKMGMGRIELSATNTETYKAHIRIGDKTLVQDLPRASERGYALQVKDLGGNSLEVSIRLKGLDQAAETMHLLTHAQQSLLSAQQISAANNAETKLTIEKSKLQEGVNIITLFNQQKQPVCERLVFVKPNSVLTVAATTDRNSYALRQPVQLSIETPAAAALGADSIHYSVAVYQAAPWEDQFNAAMPSHRWLLPYLQGEVLAPEYYFSEDKDAIVAADNLMLTQGWRSFGNPQERAKSTLRFTPELKGHILIGRVLRKSDGSPVPGELCYLSAPAYPFDLESARSDRQGYVYFEADKYYGPGEIVVKAASDSAAFFRVDILNPFSESKLRQSYAAPGLQEAWAPALQQRSVAMQAQNIFRADSLRQFSAPLQYDTLPFYGKAEYSYRMDEYKRFTTMEEVMREFVAPISVAIRGGKYYLSILDELYKRGYDENVMVLIDGIPLTDHNKIFSYDPLKVKKLDVITRRYVLGSANVGGIASFETYNGRFDAFDLDPSIILVDYEGLQLQREFYSPDYSQVNNPRIPDFRSTLFWIPAHQQAAEEKTTLKFYTGDQKGKFQVVIQGISSKGRIVKAVEEFVVQ